jgi:hypothetical protein
MTIWTTQICSPTSKKKVSTLSLRGLMECEDLMMICKVYASIKVKLLGHVGCSCL